MTFFHRISDLGFLVGLLAVFGATPTFARPVAGLGAGLYDGTSLSPVGLGDVLGSVQAPAVVIVSELHDHKPHQDHQVEVLEFFAQRGARVSVGMEFLEWPSQAFVDDFLAGRLSEPEFLVAVKWGGTPFESYRRQILFPSQSGGTTVALNAPQTLTRKISKLGIGSLSPEERSLLPEGFTLGNPLYRERFEAAMSGHVSPEALERYFSAQSVWDETMADRAVRYLESRPDQILVIVVGDFHAAWGGGLPDRLKARGAPSVTVISQVSRGTLTDAEWEADLRPHPRYGARAHAVWVDAD